MREGVARFFAYVALWLCPEVFAPKDESVTVEVDERDLDSFMDTIRGSDLMLADGSWIQMEHPAEYRIDKDGRLYTRNRKRGRWEPMEGIVGRGHVS